MIYQLILHVFRNVAPRRLEEAVHPVYEKEVQIWERHHPEDSTNDGVELKRLVTDHWCDPQYYFSLQSVAPGVKTYHPVAVLLERNVKTLLEVLPEYGYSRAPWIEAKIAAEKIELSGSFMARQVRSDVGEVLASGVNKRPTFLGCPIIIDDSLPAGVIQVTDPKTGEKLGRIENMLGERARDEGKATQ